MSGTDVRIRIAIISLYASQTYMSIKTEVYKFQNQGICNQKRNMYQRGGENCKILLYRGDINGVSQWVLKWVIASRRGRWNDCGER